MLKRIVLALLFIPLLLVLLLPLWIRYDAPKNFLLRWLEQRTGARLAVGAVHLSWTGSQKIEGILVESPRFQLNIDHLDLEQSLISLFWHRSPRGQGSLLLQEGTWFGKGKQKLLHPIHTSSLHMQWSIQDPATLPQIKASGDFLWNDVKGELAFNIEPQQRLIQGKIFQLPVPLLVQALNLPVSQELIDAAVGRTLDLDVSPDAQGIRAVLKSEKVEGEMTGHFDHQRFLSSGALIKGVITQPLLDQLQNGLALPAPASWKLAVSPFEAPLSAWPAFALTLDSPELSYRGVPLEIREMALTAEPTKKHDEWRASLKLLSRFVSVDQAHFLLSPRAIKLLSATDFGPITLSSLHADWKDNKIRATWECLLKALVLPIRAQATLDLGSQHFHTIATSSIPNTSCRLQAEVHRQNSTSPWIASFHSESDPTSHFTLHTIYQEQTPTSLLFEGKGVSTLCDQALFFVPKEQRSTLAQVFGETFNGRIDVLKMGPFPWPVRSTIEGSEGKSSATFLVTPQGISLKEPLVLDFSPSYLVDHRFPEWRGALRPRQVPSRLLIDPSSFFVPLSPFNLASVRARGSCNLGRLQVSNNKKVGKALKPLMELKGESFALWCTPLFFEIERGAASLKRVDAQIGGLFHICAWGEFSLIKDSHKLFLGLDSALVRSIFGLNWGKEGEMFAVPFSWKKGSFDLNRTELVARIGSKIAKQKGSVVGQLLGEVLDRTVAPDSGEIVPAPTTSPFPWNTSDSSPRQQSSSSSRQPEN